MGVPLRSSRSRCAPDPHVGATTAAEAIRNTYAWFEVNSGWAQPDPENLAEWVADGVCRCPDECIVAPDAWCEHGLASWWLIVQALDEHDRRFHHD